MLPIVKNSLQALSFLFILYTTTLAHADAFAEKGEILKKGAQLEQQGKQDEALKTYLDGLQKYPKDAELATIVAGMYGLKGDYQSEIKYADHAIQADPQFAKAYINRGTAQAQMRKLKEAKADFQTAAKLDPASGNGEYSLGALSDALGDETSAKKHYEKCMKDSPKNEGCLFNSAMLQARHSQLAAAKKLLEQLLALNPNAEDAKAMLRKVEADLKSRH